MIGLLERLQRGFQDFDQRIDEFHMFAGRDQRCEHGIENRNDIDPAKRLARDIGDEAPHILIVGASKQKRNDVHDALRQERSGGFAIQPARQEQSPVLGPQALNQERRIEELIAHEIAQRPADRVLLRRDQGGVGNGQSEGMAEESGHGEPIREAADNRRFCRRDHETRRKSRRVDELHGQEDENGHEQQTAGQAPVPAQRVALCLVIAFQLEHDRRRTNLRRL